MTRRTTTRSRQYLPATLAWMTVMASLLSAAPARAQTWTWDGGGADNNWTTANNWNPNSVPTNGPGTSIVLGGTTRLTPVVNVPYQVQGITFSSTAGSFSLSGTGLTIGSGGITHNDNSSQTLTVPLTLSANQTWRCTSSGALNINSATIAGGSSTLTIDSDGTFGSFIAVTGAISGSGTSLTKQGSELLRLSGANSYTGITRIEAGNLNLLGSERLSNASDLVIDGGRLDLISSGAIETVDQVTLISGDILGTGGDPAETLVANAFDVRDGDITVALAGPGALTKTTVGTVTLSAANTYSGGTTISAGVLLLPQSESLPDALDVVINGGSLDMGSNGETETIDGLTLISGAINGGSTNTLIANAFDVRSGQIDVALGGPAALTKTTAGTATLSQTNTYTGGTTANDGVLLLSTPSGPSTGDLVVQAAATVRGSASISGTLNCAGRLQPGDSLGTIGCGQLELQPSAQVDIEIGGTAGGQSDVLDVVNAMTLAGTLNVTLANGFMPPDVALFVILNSFARTGAFATLNLPSSPCTQVEYSSHQVFVLFLRSDCNTNGTADCNDITGSSSADCDSNTTPDECDLNPAPTTHGSLPANGQVFHFASTVNTRWSGGNLSDTIIVPPMPGSIVKITAVEMAFGTVQGDLGVALEHNGVTRQLLYRPGFCSGASAFGYNAMAFGMDTAFPLVLEDRSGLPHIDCYWGLPDPPPATSGDFNYAGPARPTESLAPFAGLSPAGAWTITATDFPTTPIRPYFYYWDLYVHVADSDCNTNGVPDECETDCNTNFVLDLCEPALHRADMNCDCVVDAADIAPLVQAMLDPAGYAAAYPNCTILRADTQPDALVDGDDLQELVNLLLP